VVLLVKAPPITTTTLSPEEVLQNQKNKETLKSYELVLLTQKADLLSFTGNTSEVSDLLSKNNQLSAQLSELLGQTPTLEQVNDMVSGIQTFAETYNQVIAELIGT
jgi:hypothetical protein